VEAIRTIYGPDLVPILFPNIEIASNVPEAKEVAFTLVFNKKHKKKGKATSFPSMSYFDSKSKILLIL